jgi:hypothetical protein
VADLIALILVLALASDAHAEWLREAKAEHERRQLNGLMGDGLDPFSHLNIY